MEFLSDEIKRLLAEDDLGKNTFYFQNLPANPVSCQLKIKQDCLLSGLPFFFKVFEVLGHKFDNLDFNEFEGKAYKNGDVLFKDMTLPFNVALTGERLALNLLQRSSSVSTLTRSFVDIAKKYKVNVLDTRKTTPGLRFLEKYAVVCAGGKNHRLGQVDMWMVKDNHKSFFGGVTEAVEFFRSMHGFYTPILLEVHSEQELIKGLELGVKHFMLDNFSPDQIKNLSKHKKEGVTFEVSGGIRLDTIENYCVSGVDAISIGALTHSAPAIDISFKYQRI